MTETSKSVTRISVEDHPRHNKKIVVTVGPGDVLKMRLLRERREVTVPLSYLYDYVERVHAVRETGANILPCKDPTRHHFTS